MNSTEYIKDIESTYKDCLEVVKKKSKDYATDEDPFKNFRASVVVGVDPARAILVRITDKLTRISNLLDKEPDVVGESIIDSIEDNINYFAILKSYLKNNNADTQ